MVVISQTTTTVFGCIALAEGVVSGWRKTNMEMRARLIERAEKGAEVREYPLCQQEFLIGRGSDCDLRLHSSSISRHHCIVRLAADGVTLVDLGSSNGTYLNGQRVFSQAALKSGDELRLDKYRFVLDLGDQAELHPKTAFDSIATTIRIEPPEDGTKK
jgi:pSer/pThr/pTyr-binding forkhead associated (FHA) protein